MGELILLRHGQTEWSASGKHTGRTDIPLTPAGEASASRLAPVLASRAANGHPVAAVLTSPARRAVRTAELAGLGGPAQPPGGATPRTPRCGPDGKERHDIGPADSGEADGAVKPETDPDLWEWDYGGYEGLTTPEIQAGHPGWYLWNDGVIPGDAAHPGETLGQVGERTDRVLARARQLLPAGDVILVAHGHVLRVLTARYLGLRPDEGRLFRLDTGTISTLGTEHDEPVILSWNVPPC